MKKNFTAFTVRNFRRNKLQWTVSTKVHENVFLEKGNGILYPESNYPDWKLSLLAGCITNLIMKETART